MTIATTTHVCFTLEVKGQGAWLIYYNIVSTPYIRTYISTGVQYEDLDVGVSWRQQDRWCFDGTVDSCLVRYITPYTAHDKPLDSTIEHHPHLQLSRNLNIFLLNFELIDRIVDVNVGSIYPPATICFQTISMTYWYVARCGDTQWTLLGIRYEVSQNSIHILVSSHIYLYVQVFIL